VVYATKERIKEKSTLEQAMTKKRSIYSKRNGTTEGRKKENRERKKN